MLNDLTFRELIERIRARDQDAAAELVRCYEPAIRLALRGRLTHPVLRRLLDPTDICQMVLANFFERAAQGHYELTTPDQLVRLLKAMARNRLGKEMESLRTCRRGGHLARKLQATDRDFVDPQPGPGQEAIHRELLALFHRRLSAEDRWVNDQRLQGRSWIDIADEVGSPPDVVRIAYTRRVSRVARELHLIG